VLTAKRFVGTNVSVFRSLLKVVVPGAVTPPVDRITAVLHGLAALIGALATTSILGLTGTPVVPFGGLTVNTVGAVVTVPAPVVKVVEGKDANVWPSRSAIGAASWIV